MGIGQLSQSAVMARERVCVARSIRSCALHRSGRAITGMPVTTPFCGSALVRDKRIGAPSRAQVRSHKNLLRAKRFHLKLSFGRKDVFDATHQYVF
ncbi:hypothetical protein [Dyella kyungheensis]|uniref:hypothetical protein n=1 Tax=Dyella kyungheensis TaxID=1242174 RepID=UPI00195CD639|nr:hypothetical protein [Dyella kyungheensis]